MQCIQAGCKIITSDQYTLYWLFWSRQICDSIMGDNPCSLAEFTYQTANKYWCGQYNENMSFGYTVHNVILVIICMAGQSFSVIFTLERTASLWTWQSRTSQEAICDWPSQQWWWWRIRLDAWTCHGWSQTKTHSGWQDCQRWRFLGQGGYLVHWFGH